MASCWKEEQPHLRGQTPLVDAQAHERNTGTITQTTFTTEDMMHQARRIALIIWGELMKLRLCKMKGRANCQAPKA